MFKDSSIEKNQPIGTSFPQNLSYTDVSFRTKRGFLARKLGNYLGLEINEGDTLFYLSLSKSSFSNSTAEEEYLIQLSEQMLNWWELKQDIPQKIKNLEIRNDIQNAMLKAYDVYKQDLFTPYSKYLEKEQLNTKKENNEWEIYRDIMFAATQGQFLLISEVELSKYKMGQLFCEGTIKERSDIPLCRNHAKESLEQKGFDRAKIMSWLLVLSEAITNTIKHAEEGKMALIEDVENNEIRFVIEDKGPGFPLKDLPKTTLLAGYSTKKSMGQGFTLMMKLAKRVLLFTSPKGSIIILIFDSSKGNKDKFNLTG
ncbi:ATP-binding protein [Bacillus sp. V3B]|uniref:ATP-binding protein n=1 Tax=Bacillus sp. V3B TaxID=2804915 RepID=UPI00210E16AE|nr:ATP-binding protein [Bacillus sp. V3B]MCQ6275531.1 ATP-binding protein [Bacillus sp. V3B]